MIIPLSSIIAQNFRFALITDTHLVKFDSLAYNDLKRTVASINTMPNIDFVLVTGDITGEGDKKSLQDAKGLLDQLNVKYYAIPGNHETKWSESGSTDFSRVFGYEDRFRFEHNGYLFLGFNTGPVIRMMEGHVAPQDITWLKEELGKAKKDQPVIIVTHYPLQEGDVDNWYIITDLLRQYNVKAVLGGHYHSNRLLSYDGIPGILSRSNLRDKEDKLGGYSIMEINQDSILVNEQKPGKTSHKWGGYSLEEQYYTTDNSEYKRPDYSVNKEYPNVKEVWSLQNEGAIYSSPIIYKDNVYIGDDLGRVVCFSLKNGKQKWVFKSDNRIIGTPAIENNILVFGSTDKNVYGLNASNGKLLWKYPVPDVVLSAITIDNGIAYVGVSDGTFRAIDIKSGKEQWKYSDVKGYIETLPLIYQDKVIFGAWDEYLYALNKKTGDLLWKWKGRRNGMLYSPAAVWPVAAHGKVFVTAPDRVLTAIDAETGKTVWWTADWHVRETVGLSADMERVYSKTMEDHVVCYSATANEPKLIWSTNVAYGYDIAPTMPLEKDNIVFGTTKNGLIFTLDALTGNVLWKHKVGNSLINTLVPLSGTSCVYTTTDGLVGILNVDE
jgi:outer membrane protein assembly factor BamB/predicted phosphodiesterase